MNGCDFQCLKKGGKIYEYKHTQVIEVCEILKEETCGVEFKRYTEVSSTWRH